MRTLQHQPWLPLLSVSSQQLGWHSVQAMLATSSKYSPEEVAMRVIPSLAPLATDQVAEVCVWLFLLSLVLPCPICMVPLASPPAAQ